MQAVEAIEQREVAPPPDPATRVTTRVPTRWSRLLNPKTAAVSAVSYVGALHVIDPFHSHTVGCPFLGITGWWCPGCGSSRAIYKASHGDLVGSLVYHPFVLPILILLGWWWAGWFMTSRRGEQPRWARSPTQLSARTVGLIAVAFVSLWILRNFDAFSFLAPPT